MSFWTNKRVVITGGSGLLGTALKKELKERGADVFAPRHSFVDWSKWKDASSYLECISRSESIDVVFHLAAKVGGVKANSEKLSEFFSENIEINNNVLKACHQVKVGKLVSCLSTCVYPDSPYVTYPLTENQLHLGPPHSSNFGYAYAKRMLDVQSRTFREQYGDNFITVIPNNLFGEHDNFDLENSHVIPALIRKIWEAKISKKEEVYIWGDGSPLREFTYAPDAARAMLAVAEVYSDPEPVNIGCTVEHSIASIADFISKIFEYDGALVFDPTKPTGQFRKPSSNDKLTTKTPWTDDDYTPFHVAMKATCDWFTKQYPNVRGVEEFVVVKVNEEE